MNLSQIWNTPGYFYAVGYALASFLITDFQEPVLRGWRKWLFRTALSAVLITYMTLTKGVKDLDFVITMTIVVTILYFSVRFTVRDRLKAGFYCVKTFIYGELASSLCWLVYYHLALRLEGLQTLPWQLAIMAVVFAAIIAGFYFFERVLYRDAVDLIITRRDLAIVLLTALIIFVVSNLGYLDPDGPFSGSYARDIFAMRTLVDLCGAALIYAFHSQLLEVRLREEAEALRRIMETQYQAYQISKESIEMVNQKYHDLKHQIALLRSGAASSNSEAYLRKMEQEIQSYEAWHRTGNPILDAVLTTKIIHCQQYGIELKFITDGKLLGFMEDMEISALFGNMLDNAIESVERIRDEQKRLIRLYVSGEKGFLRIRMENYCEERVRFKDGMPVTSKRDQRVHGFGVKSMLRTVTKYGGSMLMSQRDNWFELKILIPLENG